MVAQVQDCSVVAVAHSVVGEQSFEKPVAAEEDSPPDYPIAVFLYMMAEGSALVLLAFESEISFARRL